jgi:hypothetical protein
MYAVIGLAVVALVAFFVVREGRRTGRGILLRRDGLRTTGVLVGVKLRSDEWEWLCRGGSRSLFRWGDEWPESLPLGDGEFSLHRAPNAFGLELLDDPYQVECVEEMDGFVGGDGGSSLCGDRPEPEAWISFASAYRYPGDLIDKYAFPEYLDGGWLRRVLPLVDL